MNFTLFGMFSDVAVVSAFLLCAKIVRSKVAWLQNHYIPSSLIAGFAALLLSEQFAGLFAWTEEAASYPYLLICILFAGIFLGRKGVGNAKEVFSKVGDTFFVNTGSEVLCFGVPLLLGGVIMAVAFPAVFPELALLLPAGFPGGHGYAAAIGGGAQLAFGPRRRGLHWADLRNDWLAGGADRGRGGREPGNPDAGHQVGVGCIGAPGRDADGPAP